MSFHSWLQNLRSALTPRRGQRNRRRSAAGGIRAATYRPSLEVLEDRLTLSFTYCGAYPSEEVYGVAATAYDSVTADFNGDGQLDQFTMYSPEPSYSYGFVYLNRGDGTFELEGSGYAGSYDTNETTYWIGTGDLNVPGAIESDGLPDLAILHWPNDITIYCNNGDWGPYLSVNSATVTEGNAGTQTATFTVTLDPASTQTITVDYATRDVDATAGSDYQAVSGTLTFAPGETSKTINVLVNGDRLPEADESFYVVLYNPTNADFFRGDPTVWGDGTIVDDEPRISINEVTVMEGNTGTASATFTATLDAAGTEPVTVAYATADGTATAGGDYQEASGTLTFAPGETSKTITVLVNGDRLGEPNETFFVNLSSPTNATIADGQGVGTILDDEPRISINNMTMREGNGKKTTLFVFTVTLSAAYDQPVPMSYRTVDGTATAGDGDYVAKSGTLTFAPGETTKTITIEVKGDSKKEADETFYLDLFGNSSNSLFTKNRGIGTILNDD